MNLRKSDLLALRLAKDFIDEHYKQEITIQSLCNVSQLTSGRLQYGFKEMFKKPAYSYITELRMKHAADLLVTTGLSIKEIASAVGYRKTKKFSPMFKNFYKQTPTNYRRTYGI
jgi:two-component system response regulator YesN